MRKRVSIVLFVSLVFLIQAGYGFAQGDSNLANRIFSAPKTAKAKSAPPKKKAESSAKSTSKKAESTAKKVEKTTPKPEKVAAKTKSKTNSTATTAKNSTKPVSSANESKSKTKSIANSTKSTATPNPKANVTAYKTVANKQFNKFKITIVTQNPNIEIFIDDESVGKTNQKSEFVKEVEEGTYNVSAKYSEDDVIEKTVNIEKNQTIYLTKDERFNIDESDTETASTLKIEKTSVPEFETKPEPTPEPKKVEPVAVATPEPTPEPKKVEVVEPPKKKEPTMAELFQAVFDRYNQPATADSLTESDWQFIRQAVLSGETGNLSSQDAEMFTDLSLGKLDLYKRNFNTGIANLRKAVNTNPKSPFPLIEMGNAYYQSGDYRAATSYYKGALDINDSLWHIQLKYGRSLLKIGETNTALQVLTKINQSDFKSDEVTTLTAETFLANKQYDRVINLLFAETSNNPKFANCLVLAEAFEKSGNLQNAVKFMRNANELAPDTPAVLLKLGELLITTDKTEALSFINKAIELDKNGSYINLNEAQKLAKKAGK